MKQFNVAECQANNEECLNKVEERNFFFLVYFPLTELKELCLFVQN